MNNENDKISDQELRIKALEFSNLYAVSAPNSISSDNVIRRAESYFLYLKYGKDTPA